MIDYGNGITTDDLPSSIDIRIVGAKYDSAGHPINGEPTVESITINRPSHGSATTWTYEVVMDYLTAKNASSPYYRYTAEIISDTGVFKLESSTSQENPNKEMTSDGHIELIWPFGFELKAEVIEPTDPTDPTEPTDPTDPTEPTDPTDPRAYGSYRSYRATDPTDPTEPTDPTDPTEPTDPTDPTEPTDPTDPTNQRIRPILQNRRIQPSLQSQRIQPILQSLRSYRSTEPTDSTDPTEPTDPTDPTKPTEPTERTKPTDPTKPTSPTKSPTSSVKDGQSVPRTGETVNFHFVLGLGLILIALVLLFHRKRR